MSQNRSAAVMQQRSEPHHSLDDFPTPPWATRAMCEFLEKRDGGMFESLALDPCANRGHMVKPMREYFNSVIGSDVHDYGAGFGVKDYLFGPPDPVDYTFANPPFKLAEDFIDRAIQTSHKGSAIFVRSAFLEGSSRYRALFQHRPPSHVIQFSERVVIHKGRLLDPDKLMWVFDKKAGEWVERKPSTATSYCWLFFPARGTNSTEFHWFPPGTRRALTMPDDYPPGQGIRPEQEAGGLI